MSYKVGEVSITNFKKIKSLNVHPNGGNVFIIGRNGTGKTSLIQALYCVLTGKELPPNPITIGEDRGEIKIKILDDLTKEIQCIAELVFTEKNPKGKLTVTTEDGRDIPGGPRTFLDKICGKILFDPFDFIKLDEKKQVLFIKDLIGVNFDALDKEYDEVWDKRAEVNKEIKNLKGSMETSDVKEHELKIFTSKKDLVEIQTQIKNAEELNKAIREKNESYTKTQASLNEALKLESDLSAKNEAKKVLQTVYEQIKQAFDVFDTTLKNPLLETNPNCTTIIRHIRDIDQQMYSISESIKEDDERLKKGEEVIKQLRASEAEYKEYLSQFKEVSMIDMNTKYQEAVNFNQKVDKVKEYTDKLMVIDEKEALSKAYTKRLTDIKDDKMKILSEKTMPVPGLGIDFEQDCLTYNGLPFNETQISKSKIIAIGIEIMMATNPKLRICRIKDGSLLDKDTLDELINIINEQDFQAFIEIVSGETEGLKVSVQEV